jgi:hypothetical protein
MTGSIVLATKQGLGVLAKAFYDNGVIDIVKVKEHTSRQNYWDWYPNRVGNVDDLLKCDKLIFFETPFDLDLMKRAKAKGIKIIFVPMYECSNPQIVKMADVIISPSLLDQKYYEGSRVITIPVDVKWRQRERALVFVHNAGNGGLGGRNGTKELL